VQCHSLPSPINNYDLFSPFFFPFSPGAASLHVGHPILRQVSRSLKRQQKKQPKLLPPFFFTLKTFSQSS